MKFNVNTSISNRISLGYIIVTLVALGASAACVLSLQNTRNIDREITEIQLPASDLAKDFKQMVMESRRLTASWIYQPNEQDKQRLKSILDTDFPNLAAKVEKLNEKAGLSAKKEFSDEMFADFETIIMAEKQVMTFLPSEGAYASDSLVDLARNTYSTVVWPKAKALDEKLAIFVSQKVSYLHQIQKDKEEMINNLSGMMLGALAAIFIVGVAASYFSTKSITQPLRNLEQTIADLGQGQISLLKTSLTGRGDEIGKMSRAIDSMLKGLKSKADFTEEIGKGNYDNDFQLLSEKDTMGYALLDMRDNLKKNSEENVKRNWATAGLAQMGEILRDTTISSAQLYDSVLRFTVKYVGANQGSLFVLHNEKGKDDYLELVACYAYDKKKYLNKKLEVGEGLTGQSVQEKSTIFMTDVPVEYIQITSGVGEAPPTCVIIVPLKINEEVYGAIELASFKVLETFEIGFLEKLAENIASIVSSVKIKERTEILLEASQQQAQEMRSQEEEMRQNMEEMAATQEEMVRKEAQVQKLLDETRKNEERVSLIAGQHKEELENMQSELEILKVKLYRKEKEVKSLKEQLQSATEKPNNV